MVNIRRAILTPLILILLITPIVHTIPASGVEVRKLTIEPVETQVYNRTVTIYFEVYYPVEFKMKSEPPPILGNVTIKVYSTWLYWAVGVYSCLVDPGFEVDPTTFKPVEWEFAWAEGGADIGNPNIFEARNPWTKPSATLNVTLWPRTRYINASEGTYDAQLFVGVKIYLYDPLTNETVKSITLYTDANNAPRVKIIVGSGGIFGVPVKYLIFGGYVAGVAVAIILIILYIRKHRK